jgi:hypothetical protein
MRCEQLGYQFDRRELDEVYRRFVVLADKIKHVTDHHLEELVQEVQGGARRIPPSCTEIRPAALAVAVGQSTGQNSGRVVFPKPLADSLGAELNGSRLPLSPAEHHGEQEDYLWGV